MTAQTRAAGLLAGLAASGALAALALLPTALGQPLRLLAALVAPLPPLLGYALPRLKMVAGWGGSEADYLFLVTHMSAVATGRPPRHKLFELYSVTGQAYGPYSRVLSEISSLARRWGYSYAQAIRHYLRRVRDSTFRDFLARFSEAINVGEDEALVLETERGIAAANYEARYHRALDVLRVLLGIYAATMSSVIFINVNMLLISMLMLAMTPAPLLSLSATVAALAFLSYAVHRLAPRERLLHSMRVQPRWRKRVAYSALVAICAGAAAGGLLMLNTGELGLAFVALGGATLIPGLMAHRYEGHVKRLELFFQAFVRSYGLTYSVVKNHLVALRSMLRVDLGPLAPLVRRLYARLSSGIDKALAWAHFAAESGSENIRRCVDVLYDTVDSGGDVAKVGVVLSETLLKVVNLRGLRGQVVRAFQGVVYVLHIVMVVLLEFVAALIAILQRAVLAVGGANVLPFHVEAVDPGLLMLVRVVLLLALSIINAVTIKMAEGGYIQTLWLHVAILNIMGGATSTLSSRLVNHIYGALGIEELFQLTP